MTRPDTERRQEPRYHCRRPVRLFLPDGSRLDAHTEDLSARGLRIHSPSRLPAGLHLTIELDQSDAGQPLVLWSHVQHCNGRNPDGSYVLGVRHRNPGVGYMSLVRSVRLNRWRTHLGSAS